MYWNFYSSLGDRELLYFVCLPLRGARTVKLKKTLSLSCGRFHSLLVVFRNSKTRRHGEIKQTRPSAKQYFSGEALSKQNTEASLASLSYNSSQAINEFMQLLPGADRVVRHICIRCIFSCTLLAFDELVNWSTMSCPLHKISKLGVSSTYFYVDCFATKSFNHYEE